MAIVKIDCLARLDDKVYMVSKIDFLDKKLWITDHNGEEKKKPIPFCDVDFIDIEQKW